MGFGSGSEARHSSPTISASVDARSLSGLKKDEMIFHPNLKKIARCH